MVQAFELTSAALADRVAIRTKGDEQTLTWAQWRRRVRDLAGGLQRLGLERGQTLALLLGNRPEFHVADMAAVLDRHPEYLGPDRVHLTGEGYEALATVMADALSACG